MLCDISQVGVRYDCDSLDALVMISNEAKVVDHCPKTLPSGKRRGFEDEASKTAGCLDVRVDRLREFTKSSFSIADFGCTCRMECSVSRLYSITTPTSAAVAGPATGGVPTRPGQHDPERVAARERRIAWRAGPTAPSPQPPRLKSPADSRRAVSRIVTIRSRIGNAGDVLSAVSGERGRAENFSDVARQDQSNQRGNYMMELSEISVGDELVLENDAEGGTGSGRQGGHTLCLRHQLRAGLCGGRCPTAVFPARIAFEG